MVNIKHILLFVFALKTLGHVLSDSQGSINCHDLTGTSPYGGTIAVTTSGLECQRRSTQYPHEHTFNSDINFHDKGGVEGAKNFCRDPSREGRPWCYTVSSRKRWEYCNIPVCNRDCWYGAYSRLYYGTMNTTVSGRTCQRWVMYSPHEHTYADASRFPLDKDLYKAGNYCRDPDKTGQLWCYTTDPEVRWEYCDASCKA